MDAPTATFCVGIISGVVGILSIISSAIVTCVTSKNATNSQMNQLVVKEYFRARADAFSELLASYREYEIGDNSFHDEYITRLAVAFQKASLLASPETSNKILKFEEVVYSGCSNEEMKGIKGEAISAMQNDLLAYSRPTVKRQRWNLTTSFLGSSKTVNRCGKCGHTWSPGR